MNLLDNMLSNVWQRSQTFLSDLRNPVQTQPQPAKQPDAHPENIFFGQPITSGPYVLAAGTPQIIPDPNIGTGKRSARIQIQNATGFQIMVQTGVGQFSLQALTASTLPTDSGLPVTITIGSGIANFSQLLTAVWLLDGQSSPMQDGSINASPTPGTPSSIQESITYIGNNTAQNVQLLPAAGAGTSYQTYSVTITSSVTTTLTGPYAGLPATVFVSNIGQTVFYYESPNSISFVAGVPQTFLTTNPVQTTTAIYAEYAAITAPSSGTLTFTLNYFLVTT